MRTYGRIYGAVSSNAGAGILSSGGVPILPSGTPSGEQAATGTPTPVWVAIETDANGSNDMVYLVTLCQVLLLNLGEDPQFANAGIPAIPAVQQGVAPDWYVTRVQNQFSQYFASLTILRGTNANGDPAYNVKVMTNSGVALNASVPIPT